MADEASKSAWPPAGGDLSPDPEPSIPSPPEVKVRTMQSDLESMARSGGGAPQFRTVKAPELPAAAVAEGERESEKGAQPASFWFIVLVAVVALAVLAIVVYMAYSMFFSSEKNTSAVPAPAVAENGYQTQPSAAETYTATQSSTNFTHVTFFSKPVAQILTLILSNTAQSASELQTFSQRFLRVFSGTKPTSTFFEVDVKNGDGSDAGINDIFSAADTAVLAPQYVLAHFNPDATVFAYRDANGVWPGYVLKLKPTENWLYLEADVKQLETKEGQIDNFFLTAHGAPAGGFATSTMGDATFRELSYAQPGASFTYGWYRGYLIMSTSVSGLKQALARL